jgi:hypothetical protein
LLNRGHSLARVGRGAAAWFIAGGLLAAGASFTACGDDSGDKGGEEPEPDSGTPIGNRDAAADSGNGGRDAGRDSQVNTDDAGADMAAALASAGVDGTLKRAQLVFPLACTKGGECDTLDDGETVQTCTTGGLGDFEEGITTGGVPVGCADALLDFLGCTVRVSCDMETDDCVDELAIEQAECADFIDEDDAGI